VAYVAAPADRTVDVLLVTNDRNRFLATALDVIGTVSLTTVEPPAPDADVAGSDVVVFSNVEAARLLGGTVDAADRVVEDGGGVAIQAQPDLADVNYGPLLPITPTGSDRTPSVRVVEGSELVRGISFPQPEGYLTADAGRARPLVTADDSPLIATASRGGGHLLYYGYMEDTSAFKFNYQYPVFWKRAVFELAGRQPASVLSRSTGEEVRFGNETPVRGPEGERTVRAVQLDRVGWYETPDRRYGASLLDPVESSVEGTGLSGGDDGPAAGTEQRLVPRPLTHWTALAALLLVVVELGYLRRRGDL
jgi:hypothetical protein